MAVHCPYLRNARSEARRLQRGNCKINTLEQYLASTNRTAATLRAEYEKKAENDIKLEFALQKIAEVEKVTVEEKEIEEAIQKVKTEEEKKHLSANRYLLASILRQQKTLDFLKSLC
ncbi:MAG: hypothetical protein HYY87_00060 [Candidatus Levybacteria bacterium]|nr:hypothetical protein [Candidatus Levybacteria bacterium]